MQPHPAIDDKPDDYTESSAERIHDLPPVPGSGAGGVTLAGVGGVEDSDDDERNLRPEAPGAMVLHACSGPERPGSFSEHLDMLKIGRMNYDILVDRSRDLLDSTAWASLSVQV